MKCPKCRTENPEENKFCRECGMELSLTCTQCGAEVLPGDNFCGKCGQTLDEGVKEEKTVLETGGERKYVTVLFSDLSGYTALSERLDPEEVKEIMSRVFGEIAQVVTKYEGFIEKFVGDAVMALFGVPKAHEDDPIRAIRVAREIHELVDAMSPEVEKRVGKPISMHSGINTGLVVTGEVDMEKGTHGVAGDTINVASRLGNLAKVGEILVGPDTYRQAEGHFTFEDLEPTKVKGKAEPIPIYKVLSAKERPITTRRPSGLRARLVGRKAEIAQLEEAVAHLRKGKGRIFSICGEAGTGKSRLIEEFKATLDLEEIQWLEGHAYSYAQNIPYFPLIDFLNRAFQIEEGDPQEKVREKVESGIEGLIEKKEDVAPYVGSLYALSYPEVEDVSPEFWKSRLKGAVHTILSALAQRAPTIFCLEDLHCADPSFVELLRHTLLEVRHPALVLCVYRPTFTLFTSHQISSIRGIYQEIRLSDLSASDAQDMLESLLKTEDIPADLRRFIQDKTEGNPFYLEEVVNSLIESGTLTRDNGSWKVTKSITESDISSTIHGVISGRLDRLEKETKRILQEASVIGRAFLYEILDKITELKDHMDRSLGKLERLDLIRARSLEPDLEYIFKHALTQEVVYNGLLKKERREIHERIALVMEKLFHDRLPEFFETLAIHFKQGQSTDKAVDYLMKSGEKSLGRYAVEEAHQYYKEAFDLLTMKPDKSIEDNKLLIDLLIKWGLVFYYRADFGQLSELLRAHQDLAESLNDRARLGMFYAWVGFALYTREQYDDAYQYYCKALNIGEEIENPQIIGYACTWLAWTCCELGLLDDAITFGERAQEISRSLVQDHYLYYKSLGGIGYAYVYRGDVRKVFEAGKALSNYGKKHSSIRSIFMGHLFMGYGHFIAGDFPSAIESCEKGIKVSVDPIYSMAAKLLLGYSHAYQGQFKEAEDTAQAVAIFCRNFGCEVWETPARMLLGITSVGKGHMSQGLRMIEDAQKSFLKNKRKSFLTLSEGILGKLYLQIVEGAKPISLATVAKNIGFVLKNVPSAGRKAEDHFNKTIEMAKEIGARGIIGQTYLDLGFLHKEKGKKEEARTYFSESIQILEECGAKSFLKQAKEALESL